MAIKAVPDWTTDSGLPIFLQNPLKEPVAEALAHCLPTELILMVTHFALDKLKFDTFAMITLLLAKTPQESVEATKLALTDSDSLPGALVLPVTPGRTLISLVEAYCASKKLDFTDVDDTEAGCRQEFYILYSLIEGIEFVHFDPTKECHGFVFDHHPWFRPWATPDLPLFESPSTTLAFLRRRGYTPTSHPVPGCIILYANLDNVLHFAKAESLKADGTAVVLSKDFSGPLFRHDLGQTRVTFGRSCFFLTPPQES